MSTVEEKLTPSAQASIPSQLSQAMAFAAVTPNGIGDLVVQSPEWVAAGREVLKDLAGRYAAALSEAGSFTLCEVGHNPPTYLRCGSKLAFHIVFRGAEIEIGSGELPAEQCDWKIESDHSITSNMSRLLYETSDPEMIEVARRGLIAQSKWQISGKPAQSPVIASVLSQFHDLMAPRNMPRFVFMTPQFAGLARTIFVGQAHLPENLKDLADVTFTFSEDFADMPRYASPDGSHGGFWLCCDHGHLTVGVGALPPERGPADVMTQVPYAAILPLGRTVNESLTAAEKTASEDYGKTMMEAAPGAVKQSGSWEQVPKAALSLFLTLHDDLARRTTGELPGDFDPLAVGHPPVLDFDRDPNFEGTWLRYDKVDVFGVPLKRT